MKQTTNTTAFLLALTFICTNVGCKKEEEEKTKTEHLTSGRWQILAHTNTSGYDYDGNGTESMDIYSQYEACEKDDYIIFNESGTYEFNEGQSKCDSDDLQVNAGIWLLKDNEVKLQIDNDLYIIEELTSNRLRISYNDNGDIETITLGK